MFSSSTSELHLIIVRTIVVLAGINEREIALETDAYAYVSLISAVINDLILLPPKQCKYRCECSEIALFTK